MKLNILDYKGKSFIYQDANIKLFPMDFKIGETTKAEVLNNLPKLEQLVANNCHYGIPTYLGNDKTLDTQIDLYSELFT